MGHCARFVAARHWPRSVRGVTSPSEASPVPESSGLRDRYRLERDKRVRPDGNSQYIEPTGRFAHFLDDPYVERLERAPLTDEVTFAFIGRAHVRENERPHVPVDLAAELTRGGGELWNMYGPTETTIWSAVGRVAHADAAAELPFRELHGRFVQQPAQQHRVEIGGEVDGDAHAGTIRGGQDDLTIFGGRRIGSVAAVIAQELAHAALRDQLGYAGGANLTGDEVKKLGLV